MVFKFSNGGYEEILRIAQVTQGRAQLESSYFKHCTLRLEKKEKKNSVVHWTTS
jgi:hypothetical protein